MINKGFFTGAAIGVLTVGLAAAGGFTARAETGAVNPAAAAAAGSAPLSFADVVQRVAPAVVSIEVVERAGPTPAGLQQGAPFGFEFGPQNGQIPFGFQFGPPQQQRPVHGAGSGFFISPDGYVLTNNHVVEGADKITVVTKDDQRLEAHVVGTDAATDLAVLKVAGDNHPFVSFEDKAKPRVGDWVIAVGNPLGLGGTATAGIVSALGRQNVEDTSYVDFMQIDAPINHGNSGGPTFDVYGRVVGVNTAIASAGGGSIGIGFDIPADVAQSVSRQLIEHGKVVRGYIGATVQNVTPDIAASLGKPGVKGALIADVTPGGPSDKAGLRSGDIVESLNGALVATATELTREIALARPGDAIRLGVLRDGRQEDITVRSGLRPSEAALAQNQAPDEAVQPSASSGLVLGMQLEPNPSGGVTIAGVKPDSDAGEKGLSAGDVILRAGSHGVRSAADLAAAAAEARHAGRKSILVLVAHNGRQLYVPLSANGEAS
ncbi:MAG TPA: Do family serine endopeptidase [Caulobacteraceae bacterium]|nr:Do family serine endopeptidase [Caulobacteraceae bacterium]